MDQAPQIQVYVIASIVIFLALVGILFFLLVSLLTKRVLLNEARAQLQDYSTTLEKMVQERTAELKASEEMHRNLFESSREAILVLERPAGRIIKSNAEASALFGRSTPELLGARFEELVNAQIFADEGRGWQEQFIRRPDGSGRYIDCIFGNVIYQGTDCWQVICRDVTEKRELEVQLLQSMKMGALGQLAAGVAHELRTPLNTIYTSSYYIKEQARDQVPKAKKHFELIEAEIARCRKIINDLQNFSRSPAPEIELKRTDLNELLDNCLSLLEKEIRAGGVKLSRHFGKLPPILADPSRLVQVFFNLILNAVQAMPSGGALTIRTWADHQVAAHRRAPGSDEPSSIHVSVQDTGVGIPEEVLPNIFVPFFTTKRAGGGTGLGLAVSYELVKQFGGQIKVESQVGSGAKFTVSLPRTR